MCGHLEFLKARRSGVGHLKNLGVLLCLFYFPASGFARYWLVKRADSRPIALHNEALQMINGTGFLCLLAGCFMTFNLAGPSLRPVIFLASGLTYDVILRRFFFKKEVYRLCKTSNCRREVAAQRVRRRANYGSFSFAAAFGRRAPDRLTLP